MAKSAYAIARIAEIKRLIRAEYMLFRKIRVRIACGDYKTYTSLSPSHKAWYNNYELRKLTPAQLKSIENQIKNFRKFNIKPN